MPVHDWTRVEAGIFHDFHVAWLPELRKPLNGGLLPEGYYALAEAPLRVRRTETFEQAAGTRRRTLAVRHVSGHRLVALIEILSPANKDRREHVEDFVRKVLTALETGIHVLVVDLFPPGPHNPRGMHGVIRESLEQTEERPYDLPANEPLTLASYAAGPVIEAHLEHVALGAPLPDMPLFLRPDRYVNVPLEATYQEAYRGMPAFWREVLEGASSGRQ